MLSECFILTSKAIVVVVVGMLEPEPLPFLGIILLLGAAALCGLLLLDESSYQHAVFSTP